MEKYRASVAVVAVVLMAAAVGCSRTENAQIDDATIASQVRSALASDPATSNLQVTSEDGKVTLTGTVASNEAEERAKEIAKGVSGVDSVNDEIDVNEQAASSEPGAMPPASETMGDGQSPATGMGEMGDAAITTKVKSALAADPQTQALQIDVDTEDGKVKLTGEVASENEKMRAEQVARGVDGVMSIDNRLDVDTDRAAEGSPAGRSGDAGYVSEPVDRSADSGLAGSEVRRETETETEIETERSTEIAGSDVDADRDRLGARDEFSADREVGADEGELPQTATKLPLVGLIGLLALAGAVAVRFLFR